jgi:hypothetical protein
MRVFWSQFLWYFPIRIYWLREALRYTRHNAYPSIMPISLSVLRPVEQHRLPQAGTDCHSLSIKAAVRLKYVAEQISAPCQ